VATRTLREAVRRWVCGAAAIAALALPPAATAQTAGDSIAAASGTRWSSFLPLRAELATSRGIELPLPFGVGLVYYHLDRDIVITDVRVGRNGAPPVSVSDYATLSATSDVENLNLKVDAWLLPFVNVYGILGYVFNESDTRIDVTLPPLLPSNPPRQFRMDVPTSIEGSIAGLGTTIAGGYPPYFVVVDINAARADLGFDNRLKAVVASTRAGWTGEVRGRTTQLWLGATNWNTFATPTGTVTDPDGGSLRFEVDQGPLYEWTYSVGAHVNFGPRIETAIDLGTDFHGGWTLALIPGFRF
jgi:hypothetical protein